MKRVFKEVDSGAVVAANRKNERVRKLHKKVNTVPVIIEPAFVVHSYELDLL